MNTKDEKPDGKNTDRDGGVESPDTKPGQTKNGKEAGPEGGGGPDKGDVPYEDSVELFSSLFRAETQALTQEDLRVSQAPKADSPPGKAGVSPPAQRPGQRSGPPRAKAPASGIQTSGPQAPRTQAPRPQAPRPQASGTQVKGAPKRPTPQGPKAAGKAAVPPGSPKKGPAAPKKQAGPPPGQVRIPRPQGERPAQGPPARGPGAEQGAARGPSKAGAGGIPPKKETIRTAPEPSPPREEKIPIKEKTKDMAKNPTKDPTKEKKSGGKKGGGRKTLRLVILLAVLVVLAAFSLHYLGIIGPQKPRHAATAVRRHHKKARVTRKVRKRPPIKVTKAAPISAKQASVKHVPAQAAQQGAAAPEKPKAPAQQTKVASPATTSVVRKPPVPAPTAKAQQEPAAKAPASKARAPVAALSAYPYAVYLGSYERRKSLKRAVSEYRGMGLSPYWVQVDLGSKGIWYRVFTGYFPSKEAAIAFIREKNIKDGEHRNTRYANLIGVSRSEQELQKPRLSVEEAGFCPYMVRGPAGQWMLYTGAFYQKARAEKQNRALLSKGIQSRLVER